MHNQHSSLFQQCIFTLINSTQIPTGYFLKSFLLQQLYHLVGCAVDILKIELKECALYYIIYCIIYCVSPYSQLNNLIVPINFTFPIESSGTWNVTKRFSGKFNQTLGGLKDLYYMRYIIVCYAIKC